MFSRIVQRWLSIAVTGGLALSAIPVASASGLGLGVDLEFNNRADVHTDAHARIERRCMRLDDADREECLRLAALHVAARGDSELRAEARAAHGRFMSELRAQAHAEEDDDHERGLMARMRLALREMMMRIQAAFMTEAKASLQACQEKTGAEREQCVIDAKAALSTKADAAVRVIRGL